MPDFFTNLLLSTPLPQGVRDQANAILVKAERAMPWVGSLQGPAGLLFNQGRWPMPATPADVTSDPAQQQQWAAFVAAYKPLNTLVLKGAMADALAEAARVNANADFWNTAFRVDLAIATLGVSELWDQLQQKLQEYRAAKQAAVALLTNSAATVHDPKYASSLSAATIAQQTALEAELRDIDAAAAQQLGPLATQAEVKAAAGLGIVPAFVAPLAYATLAAIIAGFATYALARIVSFKSKVADYAQTVLVAREAADRADVTSGAITQDEYARRRGVNSNLADKANEAAGFGMGSAMKYVAIAAGLGLAAMLIYKLVPKRKSA